MALIESQSRKNAGQRKIEVWFVDDCPTEIFLFQMITRSIPRIGSIKYFLNGKMAITELVKRIGDNAALPEVIFLDINMPVMNGWEFLDEYRNLPPAYSGKTTIVMASSTVNEQEIRKANADPNVRMFIEKPISTNSLASIFS